MRIARSGWGAAALAGTIGIVAWLAPAIASADAVPPPSVLCRKNERVVVDHGGGHCEPTSCPPGQVIAAPGGGHPRCVPPAPKDCPTGWVGVPGPHCSLALCSDEVPCPTGTTCKASPVCTRDDQGYSSTEPEAKGLRGLFAAPRALAPSREYRAACDASQACTPNEVCRAVRVCLPASADRAAPAPANALASRIWGSSSIPKDQPPIAAPTASASSSPSASASSAPVASAPIAPVDAGVVSSAAGQGSNPSAVPPQGGRGGAGCAAGGAGGPAWAGVAVASLAALVRVRRRARRPR